MVDKTKVLIVDDHRENIVALRGLIQSHDVEILEAVNAREALSLLTDHEFGLALLDVQMPETTGFELARLLRGVRRCRHLPVIFVTAHQQNQNVVFEGYETGAVDFLFKPLDPHVVRSKVRVFVELHQQRLQLQAHVNELQRLRLEAESATYAKSQFLANMSHEIRTPLAAVMGFADLLARREYCESERLQLASSVKRNGEHLLRLIGDILDISRIEANRLDFEVAPFELNDVLREVQETLSIKAAGKEVELHMARLPAPAWFRSDRARVKQVMLNVVGNAIKFSERGGSVNVDISLRPGRDGSELIAITVTDQGIGMSKSQADKLFQPFTQADASTQRRFGGSGLGLTISRQIAEALGGYVKLVKSAPALGSTFALGFELERAEDPASEGETPQQSSAAGQAESRSLKDRDILIVDDSSDNLMLFEMYLRDTDARLTMAESGAEAIALVRGGKKFDLVLMDVQMPGMDGHQATRELRRLDFRGPIIALTAHALSAERQKCINSGCNDTLTKPISQQTLIRNIRDYFSQPIEFSLR